MESVHVNQHPVDLIDSHIWDLDRNVRFSSSNIDKQNSQLGLQHDTTLMLMFDPPRTDKLYYDQFPHVWSTLTNFSKSSPGF
jgi:hypothetical protein